MRIKLLARFFEKVLGPGFDEKNRADMHLPVRLLGIAVTMLIVGLIGIIITVISPAIQPLAIAAIVVGIPFAAFAFLCWKNQKIVVLSDEEFEYTTMLGMPKTYKFADIRAIRMNRDSMTMFVGDSKVHIEKMAILSKRLIDLINIQLEKNNPE